MTHKQLFGLLTPYQQLISKIDNCWKESTIVLTANEQSNIIDNFEWLVNYNRRLILSIWHIKVTTSK